MAEPTNADFGGVRVKFWTCRNRSHLFVDWDGDLATCRECGATNEPLTSHSWQRIAHKGSPALRCSACGYVWKPDSLGPVNRCPHG